MKKLLWGFAMFLALVNMAFAAVNLNTATKEELEAVKGIGPVKAKAIVEYRQKNGQFKSLEDLKNVTGFGEKSVHNLRAELTISGGSTPKKEEKPAKPEADPKAAKKEKVEKK